MCTLSKDGSGRADSECGDTSTGASWRSFCAKTKLGERARTVTEENFMAGERKRLVVGRITFFEGQAHDDMATGVGKRKVSGAGRESKQIGLCKNLKLEKENELCRG